MKSLIFDNKPFTTLLFLFVLIFNSAKAQKLDDTFNPVISNGGVTGSIYAIAKGASLVESQSNGKIYVGGIFSSINGVSINNIARLNPDGTLDNTFNPGTGANNGVYAIAVQSDGKVIVGGDFTFFNGISKPYLIRLNTDGSIDNTFSIGLGPNNVIRAITIQSDSKILISGNFTSVNSIDRGKIARLNSDGTVDSSFDSSTGANSTVRSIAVQSDNKVIIVGSFTNYKGSTANYITRLNSNGSIDGTFNSTGVNATINFVTIKNNLIYITGSFTTYSGNNIKAIAVINADGSLNNTFNSTIGITGPLSITNIPSVLSIIPRNNTTLYIAGDFNNYNNTTLNRFAKLNSNGIVSSPNPFAIASNHIINVQMESGDFIYLGGLFSTFEGNNRTGLVRLLDPQTSSTITALDPNNVSEELLVNVYPNPSQDLINVKIEAENISAYEYTVVDDLGKEILKGSNNEKEIQINLKGKSAGLYLIRFNLNGKILSKRIIKN